MHVGSTKKSRNKIMIDLPHHKYAMTSALVVEFYWVIDVSLSVVSSVKRIELAESKFIQRELPSWCMLFMQLYCYWLHIMFQVLAMYTCFTS